MKKIKFKSTKGITLIALVITIVVLLILAGVSIATLTGENGILTQAEDAKTKTTKEEARERIQLEMLASIGNDGKYNVEKAKQNLKDNLGLTEESGNVVDNGDGTLTIKEKGYEFFVNKEGVISVAGASGATKLAGDVLKVDSTATDAAAKSPYVKYNGLDCRVLYNDETHGLQIITAGSVGNVTLGYGDTEVIASDFTYDGTATVNDNFKKAAASYNNAVDNLNKKAKTYMDTKGIATDARCLGSNPTLTSDSKFQSDVSGMWSGTYDYLTTYSWNNKFKTADTNYKDDVGQLNTLGLNVSSGNTWLASRDVCSSSYYAYFLVRFVISSGDDDLGNLCNVYSDGSTSSSSPSFGFRPIFLLSSNIVISDGDGSSEKPYVIE